MPRHCYVLRVFTRDGEGGNALGVVTDVLGLDDAKMQRLTIDLGFSETIFLNWFEGPIPRARIFTPSKEIPFAGHPLVGAAWVLLKLGPLDPGGIECAIGPVQIRQKDELTWVDAPAGQPIAPFDAGHDLGAIEMLEVRVPSPYKLIQVRSPSDVSAINPADLNGLGDVYVWAWEREGELVRARFFAPDFGIEEDAATGSAAVALGARMRGAGVASGDLLIHQGEEMGHPSELHLEWNPRRTSIGGNVIRDEVRFLRI
jgi:trans-2,3-dihydro-3-hydroxyanthranilate isomerase